MHGTTGGTLSQYLAPGVDGRQDDVVVPVGRFDASPAQRVRVRRVPCCPSLGVGLLAASLASPAQAGRNTSTSGHPYTHTPASATLALGAIDQQTTGPVVGREGRHHWGGLVTLLAWRGRRLVGGWLVGRPVDETLVAGLHRRSRPPYHHRYLIVAVTADSREREETERERERENKSDSTQLREREKAHERRRESGKEKRGRGTE